MATIAEARRLAKLVWPGGLTGIGHSNPFPGIERYVAARVSKEHGVPLRRVMVEAEDRRAALAGLCAALREMAQPTKAGERR